MKKNILENKVVVAMTKATDLMIISVYWLLLCIPVITIVPSTAALYYTSVKAVRRDRGNLTSEFFQAFKMNLKQGMLISLIYVIIGVVLYTCIDFSRGVGLDTGLGKLYFTFGIVAGILIMMLTFYLIPALSRFQVGITGLFRLALYFTARNLVTLIPLILTFVMACVTIYCIVPLICIIPGAYCYLLSYSVESTFKKYIQDHMTSDADQSEMWFME